MDTIVALSTAPGRSAIGVIRVSGPDSVAIAKYLVGDSDFTLSPRVASLQSLRPPGQSAIVDQALLTFFQSPNSYTGEDVLEISCHGAPVILRQVIDAILRFGSRLAEPGEFTLRALSNGKLNLTQAIAVRDLISARTDAAAKQAIRQLQGELSRSLQPTKETLIHAIVKLESALEFVEDDLPKIERVGLLAELSRVSKQLSDLAATFDVGRMLRDGLRVAIVGRPNVGKSSLFNRLVSKDRAIVTEIPGTTRDSLTESITLQGVPIFLTDTAGVRESTDRIEKLGVERSREAIADADLALVVVDGSAEFGAADLAIILETRDCSQIVVRNKKDLPSFRNANGFNCSLTTVDVSALSNTGLDDLRAAIIATIGLHEATDAALLITDARQHDLLERAVAEVQSSEELLNQGASEELILVGLHNALRFVGEITGETTSDEILGEIFATFCIGK
jgi:tRNA modification GTPase